MDNQSMTWLPDMQELEDRGHIMKHQQTRPYYSDSTNLFSSESFKHSPTLGTTSECINATTINSGVDKQHDQKATNISPFAPSHVSTPNTFTISFRNPTSPRGINNIYGRSKQNYMDVVTPEEEMNLNEFLGCTDGTTTSRNTRRNDRQLQEHVMAERKRREKLAERFISLSTLLPGLKKMDKATVLEDARKYIIQLQSRVKELEESSSKGKDIIHEPGIVVPIGIPKFCGGHEDVASSSNDTNDLSSSATFSPEIKARISGNNMLVRIFCMRSSSFLLKTLTEMERLHITIVCCSVLPFDKAHLITIVAQMSDEMAISAKYLVQCLISTLRDFH